MKLTKTGLVGLVAVLILLLMGITNNDSFFSQHEQQIEEPVFADTPQKKLQPVSQMSSLEIKQNIKPFSSLDKNTFLFALQKCVPTATAAIESPSELFNYLKMQTGIETEDKTVENYHLLLPDKSLRRIHIVIADNTNSTRRKELRFFRVDAEGYPERIPLKSNQTVQSLLKLGEVTNHEVKMQFVLKDGSVFDAEFHNQTIFEFQYNQRGKILSCRNQDCRCW